MRNTRPKETEAIDPLIGSTVIANAISSSNEYALRLMRSGAFGELFDIGSGDVRPRPRVRKSGLDAWIASRKVGAA